MPLVMSQEEWARIGRWADHDKEDPETLRRREHVQHLTAASRAMTKAWPNSLENVNKRNEDARRERQEAAEAANTTFYKRYVRRKQQEQERLMFSARDTIFKNKDAPKLLLGAVIETVVQKERIEQLKFLEEQRRYEAEQKRLDDADIIRKAQEWQSLLALKKQRRFDANKQHQKEILDQAHEVAERNRIEYETELNLQKVDNVRANEQMEAIKKFEDDFKTAEKNRIWSDMERARQETAQRRREQAARDQLDDRLIKVLLQSRARVERQRKRTEKELKEEKLRVLEEISQKLESGDAARDAKDQAMLDKAIKEKEAVAEARRAADERKRLQFLEQRRGVRSQCLRDERQRLHEFNTTRQWEIMNRFKNAEIYEDFQENLRNEKARKIKEYREDILKLWKERSDREARERAETRYFYGELAEQKLRRADNKLLAHAAALSREARAHARPGHALHRAVDRYCRLHRLHPLPGLPAPVQEHFPHYAPRDGCRPDPCYKEEPTPPPDRGPDAPDEPQPAPPPAPLPAPLPAPPQAPHAQGKGDKAKRDGLQNIGKMGPAKEAEPPASAYKRAGPANGLQRRPKQTDLLLPPLSVLPCKTQSCRCDIKQ